MNTPAEIQSADLTRATKPKPVRKVYTLDDYKPFLAGDAPLPNFEELQGSQWNPKYAGFLNNLAAIGHRLDPHWGHSIGVSKDRGKQWTMYFLTPSRGYGQGGGKYDGGGYAVVYASKIGVDAPIVGKFMICRHEVVDEPGANHSRGWHPGHCKHCGLDMTYDSGD
jgi:hypothetical protein